MDRVSDTSVLEQLLRRDRTVSLIALLAASLLAWTYLLFGPGMDAQSMSMPNMVIPMASAWSSSYFALMLAMWSIMMAAMMLPSAAPMILLFATVERRRRGSSPFPATAIFATAYVIVWVGFSVAAVLLQWQLDRLAMLSPSMATASAVLAGGALILIGAYQFTLWKQACLRNCRSPLEFITWHWNRGPFAIGLRHGIYCVGCCWMLMLLLFIGGVMNLLWVALIAAFVLAEKTLPRAEWLSYGAGAALIGWGGWTLFVHAFP
jgi:predicted metal-binding membrane protein